MLAVPLAKEVDSIEFYSKRIADLDAIIAEMRAKPQPPMTTGIVTFASANTASMAAQSWIQHGAWVLSMAPEPCDIIWEARPRRTRARAHVLVWPHAPRRTWRWTGTSASCVTCWARRPQRR